MELKVKLLSPDSKAPTKGTPGAAGWDLYVRSFIPYVGKIHYLTGVAVEIPEGHVGLLFPRSSIVDRNVRLSNCVGVIDSDYRGEVKAVMDIVKSPGKCYSVGDRCAQLVVIPLTEINSIKIVDKLTPTRRLNGGFGSTGE